MIPVSMHLDTAISELEAVIARLRMMKELSSIEPYLVELVIKREKPKSDVKT